MRGEASEREVRPERWFCLLGGGRIVGVEVEAGSRGESPCTELVEMVGLGIRPGCLRPITFVGDVLEQ